MRNINIRFADSIEGKNMTRIGFNKKYIGYSRKNTNNPKDYIWTKNRYTKNEIVLFKREEAKRYKNNTLKFIFISTIVIIGVLTIIISEFKLLNNTCVNPNNGFNIILESILGLVEFVVLIGIFITFIEDLRG